MKKPHIFVVILDLMVVDEDDLKWVANENILWLLIWTQYIELWTQYIDFLSQYGKL